MATAKEELQLPKIFSGRRCKVVLDADLATLYGVPTSRLNEVVKRNRERFPAEFSFVLTNQEVVGLRSQIAILDKSERESLGSQILNLRSGSRGQHRKYAPRVFTEHGALMAATVLRSERAVQMSLYLVRAFVQMREALLANTTILKRLAEIDRRLIEHDSVLREVVERLQPLLDAPKVDESAKPKIGYHRGNR
jgi:hypothetical protein